MKRALIVSGGWVVFGLGVLLLPVPLPLPFPAGPILILVGSAILTPHSKTFRRGVQRLRHRFGWLSRAMDTLARRAPPNVQTMMERTRPIALERFARLRADRAQA